MCAHARQLSPAGNRAGTARLAPGAAEARAQGSRGEAAVIVGFGAIARRLVELLAPLHMRLCAVPSRVVGTSRSRLLARTIRAPSGAGERGSRDRRPSRKRVDGSVLRRPPFRGLQIRRGLLQHGTRSHGCEDALQPRSPPDPGGSYLDVTTVEPLPADHPCGQPECFITPHTGEGTGTKARVVQHFLDNLAVSPRAVARRSRGLAGQSDTPKWQHGHL